MHLRTVREDPYLRAELRGRETAEQMREAFSAILAECRRHGLRSVLLGTRASRPLFSWEISRAPAARESELLEAFRQSFGRLPRLNQVA